MTASKETLEAAPDSDRAQPPDDNTDGPGNSTVTVNINNNPYRIHRGAQLGAEIKRVGKVDPADELSQLVNGKWVLVVDTDRVVIKGAEQFQSNPPVGGSS